MSKRNINIGAAGGLSQGQLSLLSFEKVVSTYGKYVTRSYTYAKLVNIQTLFFILLFIFTYSFVGHA